MKVTAEMREKFFNSEGWYASDETIAKWWNKLEDHHPLSREYKVSVRTESTGGKTDFYNCSGCSDVDDLAEHWDMRGDEFNCLKALVGIAKGSRHSGTNPLRDANKLVHYANRILRRVNEEKESS